MPFTVSANCIERLMDARDELKALLSSKFPRDDHIPLCFLRAALQSIELGTIFLAEAHRQQDPLEKAGGYEKYHRALVADMVLIGKIIQTLPAIRTPELGQRVEF